MIEFITLFLGALVAGPTQVELTVASQVTAVEILLDAEVAARLYSEPWAAEVDFGEELAPHLLEAVAYGVDGGELGRARQWVNLAPHQAEASVVLVRDPDSDRVRARVSWQSLTTENEPLGVDAVFDGVPLEVEDPRLISLPPHDPDALHHLKVELEFPGSLRSTAEITFGGGYRDEVSTELTAFAVSLAKGADLPPVSAMQSWFSSGRQSLAVRAAEKGLAEIVVVRDGAARPHLDRRVAWRSTEPIRPILRKDHRLRFVGVTPAQLAGPGGSFLVFPRSPEVRERVGGLARSLSSVELPQGAAEDQRLADAVAVAGLFASQSGRRRAVVVITTGSWADASQFRPDQVRRYLGRLGVPLVVWNPQRGAADAGAWGSARNISSDSRLEEAYKRLSKMLDRQRIVWLNGLHLPQRIVLGAEAEGVEPAG